MNVANRFFVDTNVLLYSLDGVNRDKQRRASEWISFLWSTGSGVLSWQVLHEFYANATRKLGLETEIARTQVRRFQSWEPLDTSFALVERAWYWLDSAGLSYWDGLILAAAERSGARYLLSEDFQANRQFHDVRIVNPFHLSPKELTQAIN